MAHTPTACVAARIPQIDSITYRCFLVAAFGCLFDQQDPRAFSAVVAECSLAVSCGKAPGVLGRCRPADTQIHKTGSCCVRLHQIQPGLYSFSSTSGSLCTGGSSGVIDSRSLRPAEDLYKSFSVCSEDRKYFSGASGIKISDNEHPLSDLGDTEIRAVKHHPFHAVPQVIKRGEDGRKRPALVMRKQSWNVLKQKIRRSSGLSQAGNLKEESASGIFKSLSSASI